MALIIFVITQTKRAQSEICLALNDSEFHGLFKNADSLNHKHFLDNEKDQTNLEPFFWDTLYKDGIVSTIRRVHLIKSRSRIYE